MGQRDKSSIGRRTPGKDGDSAGMTAAFALGLGFSLITTTMAGAYLGWLLDKRSGKTYFTPLGILLGLIVSFHRAVVSFRALSRKDK